MQRRKPSEPVIRRHPSFIILYVCFLKSAWQLQVHLNTHVRPLHVTNKFKQTWLSDFTGAAFLKVTLSTRNGRFQCQIKGHFTSSPNMFGPYWADCVSRLHLNTELSFLKYIFHPQPVSVTFTVYVTCILPVFTLYILVLIPFIFFYIILSLHLSTACYLLLTDSYFDSCCSNIAHFLIVGLIKDYLILSHHWSLNSDTSFDLTEVLHGCFVSCLGLVKEFGAMIKFKIKICK